MSSDKSSKPKLSLVNEDIYRLDRKPETTSERVRRLQAEARMLAREQVEGEEHAHAPGLEQQQPGEEEVTEPNTQAGETP